MPVINILPLTSYKQGRKIYPNEVFLEKTKSGGLDKDSIVLCYQIRTVDKKRLIKPIGIIQNDETKNEIIDTLRFQLGFMV